MALDEQQLKTIDQPTGYFSKFRKAKPTGIFGKFRREELIDITAPEVEPTEIGERIPLQPIPEEEPVGIVTEMQNKIQENIRKTQEIQQVKPVIDKIKEKKGRGLLQILYEESLKKPFSSFMAGTQQTTSNALNAVDQWVNLAAEKLGIGEVEFLKNASDFYTKSAEQFEKEGIESGLGKYLYQGIGQAAIDLPVIMSTGLPGYSAFMGGAEAIEQDENIALGVAKGLAHGLLLHKIFKTLGFAPAKIAVPTGGIVFGGESLISELQKPEGQRDYERVASDFLIGMGMTFRAGELRRRATVELPRLRPNEVKAFADKLEREFEPERVEIREAKEAEIKVAEKPVVEKEVPKPEAEFEEVGKKVELEPIPEAEPKIETKHITELTRRGKVEDKGFVLGGSKTEIGLSRLGINARDMSIEGRKKTIAETHKKTGDVNKYIPSDKLIENHIIQIKKGKDYEYFKVIDKTDISVNLDKISKEAAESEIGKPIMELAKPKETLAERIEKVKKEKPLKEIETEKINEAELDIGDKFKISGEKFTVTDKTEFGTRVQNDVGKTLDDFETIVIDKGSFIKPTLPEVEKVAPEKAEVGKKVIPEKEPVVKPKEITEPVKIEHPSKTTEFFAGLPVAGKVREKVDKLTNLMVGKPKGEIREKGWDIVKDYYGKRWGMEFKYSDKWQTELKDKFSKAEREDMMFYRQKTGNIWKKNDTPGNVESRLSPEAKRFVDNEIAEHIDNWREFWNNSPYTKDINAREEVIKTYLTGVYAGNVKKGYERLVGLKGRQFVTSNFMRNKKQYLNFDEAFRKAGLVPRFRDMTDQLNYQDNYMIRLFSNNELIGEINKLQKDLDQKLIVRTNSKFYDEAKAQGYESFDDAWLRNYVAGTDKEGKPIWATSRAPALVHPELAESVRSIFQKDPYIPEKTFWKGYGALANFIRYSNVTLSGFHFVPLMESFVGGKGLRIINPTKWIRESNKILKDREMVTEMKEAGVRFTAPSDAARRQIESGMKKMINVLEASGGLKKYAGRGIDITSKPQRALTRFMFDKYMPVLKTNIYYTYKQRMLDKNAREGKELSEIEMKKLNREIASTVNDQFGSQAWETIRVFNDPKFRKWMHRLVAYPDWTVSALRQAGAVLEPGTRGYLARRYWVKYGLVFLLAQNAINYLTTGFYNDEETGEVKWDFDKAHSTFENEDPKHKLNFQFPDVEVNILGKKVNLGRDEKGKKYYSHFGKQMLEIPRYMTDPISQAFSKSNPVIRIIGKNIMGGTPYKGEIFPARGAYIEGEYKAWGGRKGIENLKERVKSFTTDIIPFSLQNLQRTGAAGLATVGALPISKSQSLYASRDEIRNALKVNDEEKIDKIKSRLMGIGYKESTVDRTITVIRNSLIRESDIGIRVDESREVIFTEKEKTELFGKIDEAVKEGKLSNKEKFKLKSRFRKNQRALK